MEEMQAPYYTVMEEFNVNWKAVCGHA